jgi:hypothetical protein
MSVQYLYLFAVDMNSNVNNASMSNDDKIDKTANHINVSADPEAELAVRNGPEGSVYKDTCKYAGQWTMCLKIKIGSERKIDVIALWQFWRTGWRTLLRRVYSGVRIAMGLNLEWNVEPDWMHLFWPEATTVPKSRVHEAESLRAAIAIATATPYKAPVFANDEQLDRLNSLDSENNQVLFHKKEATVMCFTAGAVVQPAPLIDANLMPVRSLAKRLPDRSVVPSFFKDPDWEELANNLVDPLTTSLKTPGSESMQALGLEMMLSASDSATVDTANQFIANLHATSRPGSVLSRVGIGREPFKQLSTNVGYICRAPNGDLDDDLLAQVGPHCYNDISEARTQPMSRVPLHKNRRCVCGAKNSLTRLVRVRLIGQEKSIRPRRALQCNVCGRTTHTSLMYYTDISALRTRIGEQPSGRETASVLNVVDEMFAELEAPELRRMPAPKRNYASSLGAQLDTVLGITNSTS